MMLQTAPIRQPRSRVFGRGFGDATPSVANLATLTNLRNSFPPNSADWTIVNNLIQNPSLLNNPIGQGQLQGAIQAAAQAVAAAANPTYTYTDAGGVRRTGASVPAGATNVTSSASALTTNPNPAVVQAAAQLVPAPTPVSDTSSPFSPDRPDPFKPIGPIIGVITDFTLTNQTRGGQDFQVGDNWSLTVTGPAGQPVYIDATHNGQAVGKSQFGVTDSNGNFTLQGSMGADSIGPWTERYYVGSTLAGSTSFQVLQSPGPSGTQSSTPVDLTNTTGAMATTTTDPAPAPADFGVTNPIPWWGWAAIAAGALFLMREA